MGSKSSDVLILGGGIIGLTTAYYCAREGLAVTVAERGAVGREASWAGAGMLPARRRRGAASPSLELAGWSAELYPELCRALSEESGVDTGYRRCGELALSLELPDAELEAVGARHGQQGIPRRRLTPPQARELEPALTGPFALAREVPETAQLRNPRHLRALLVACRRRGVEVEEGAAALELSRQGRRVTGARTTRGSFAAGVTVVAAGAWSREVLAALGVELAVRPVRGQIVLLASPAPLLRRVITIGPRYLVPRPDGRLLIGSTMEDAGFDTRTTAEGVRGLLDLALSLVPGLGRARLEATWAGLRPGGPDGDPYLGPVPGWEGILVATGHLRHGILMAPGTGRLLCQHILGQEPDIPLEGFRLDRPLPA